MTKSLVYDRWQDVPADQWPWRHFSPEEMACRGSGRLVISAELLDRLEALRAALGGRPLIVTSGYRSPEHNRRVGGAPASQHLKGTAVDIAIANHNPRLVEQAARGLGFGGVGRYPERGFIHLDLGADRTWGAASWPGEVTQTHSAEATKPKATSLGTIKAGATGLVTSAAAASGEVYRLVSNPAARSTAESAGSWAVTVVSVLAFVALLGMVVHRLRRHAAEGEGDEPVEDVS